MTYKYFKARVSFELADFVAAVMVIPKIYKTKIINRPTGQSMSKQKDTFNEIGSTSAT